MKRILIIEDDIGISEALQSVFEVYGYEVKIAHNGAIGLIEAEAFKPDIILLDICMPIMDGHQFLDEQERRETIKNIPVVTMTANHNALKQIQTRKIAGSIFKPIEIDVLIAAIEKAA